jgi:hypothetical protein
METLYALVKNNVVIGVIVADVNFIVYIQEQSPDQCDLYVNVTDLENRPHIGDVYDLETQTFSHPE